MTNKKFGKGFHHVVLIHLRTGDLDDVAVCGFHWRKYKRRNLKDLPPCPICAKYYNAKQGNSNEKEI